MQSVCVFCGSTPGANPAYAAMARTLGALLADEGITLVYGGAQVGLMGILANSAVERGGRVVGVLPEFLASKEVAHPGITEVIFTRTMHERKMRMAELSDGFIAMPGGLGTLEELLEIVTWIQLGLQAKPCGVLNVDGFFDALLAMLERATADQFLWPEHLGIINVDSSAAGLLARLRAYHPPNATAWVRRS